MIIDYVHYPFIYTDTGKRVHFDELTGKPNVGDELTDDLIVVKTQYSDVDCPNGVCPIK